MAKFESVVSGNISTTPIKGANPIMSPTEVAAFDQPAVEAVQDAPASSSKWELVVSEPLPANNFGITTSGVRETRRMEVPGGYLYAVSTWYVSYIRGVADTSVSETVTFVPAAKAKK